MKRVCSIKPLMCGKVVGIYTADLLSLANYNSSFQNLAFLKTPNALNRQIYSSVRCEGHVTEFRDQQVELCK
jgi:hypothetical protein